MTSSNEYPNTFPVRFKKVLPAHRICRNALVSAEPALNCPGSIILSQNWRRAQTAAIGWHQGRRHSPLDDQSFAGKVSQDQFTLLAIHVDGSPGSTSDSQQAWNEQPGPVQKDPSDPRNTRVCFGPRGWRLTRAQMGWDEHYKHKHWHLCPQTLQWCISSSKEQQESESESEWWAEDSTREEERLLEGHSLRRLSCCLSEMSDVSLQHQPEHRQCSRKSGEVGRYSAPEHKTNHRFI